MAGAGIAYGYRYDVSRRFALEATVGVGLAHVDYDKYLCDRCGEEVASGNKLYFGPMRTGLNIIYRIGSEPMKIAEVKEIPMPAPAVVRDTLERIIEKVVRDTVYITEYVPSKKF